MGIVYIDEMDKLRGIGVQHAQARSPRCRRRAQPGIDFDTTSVLFICGGAFVGLEDISARRIGRGGFWFLLAANSQVAGDGLLLRHDEPEDLEAFGLIPEIIGRLRTPWAWMVSSDPEEILVAKFRKLVRFHGADLTFTEGGCAGDRQDRLGAWDGNQGVEEVLEGVLFEVEEGVRIPADPPELLPMLAQSGNFGIFLVGEPVPDVNLAGVVCPGCGEDDVNWLQVGEGMETVHCDRCGAEFALAVVTVAPVTPSRQPSR